MCFLCFFELMLRLSNQSVRNLICAMWAARFVPNHVARWVGIPPPARPKGSKGGKGQSGKGIGTGAPEIARQNARRIGPDMFTAVSVGASASQGGPFI